MGLRNSTEIAFDNFSGGRASAKNKTSLEQNEALSLDNIVIKPQGMGFRSMNGNTEFNGTVMVDATTVVAGLSYYSNTGGNTFLCAVAGTKLFKSDSLDGTMDDVTGALTITSGQNNLWQMFTYDDVLIGVGGAPDAPFKFTGTGNGAVLGGSPPSGSFGFAYNNRVFIGGTSANPSRINWTILKDSEDWSGTGSGNADVALNDGDSLVGAGQLNDTNVLLFKKNSVHRMVGKTSPFSFFQAFQGVGAAGKNAIVVVDGLCYFVTPQGRMVITDGNSIIDSRLMPRLNNIDDVWDGLNQSRLAYIQGIRYKKKELDWIIWTATNGSGTTNDVAIIWDLLNKCWITASKGFEGNTLAINPFLNNLYMGGYVGKIYTMDVSGTNTNASNASAKISWKWQSGWLTQNSLDKVIKLHRVNGAFTAKTVGNITISYGYDFSPNERAKTFSMQGPGGLWDAGLWDVMNWGGLSDVIRNASILGRGNVFNYQVSGDDQVDYNMSTIVGTQSSQKHFEAG